MDNNYNNNVISFTPLENNQEHFFDYYDYDQLSDCFRNPLSDHDDQNSLGPYQLSRRCDSESEEC